MKEKIQSSSNLPLYKIDSIFVAIICIESIGVSDIGITIATFRKLFPDVLIQGINPNFIYGKRHIFEVIKIILESNKRKINITKRLEMELLLRLVCCNQVDKAIDIGGIKNNGSACFVLLSEKKRPIIDSIKHIRKMYVKQNICLLRVTKEKMNNICERLEFPCNKFNRKEFLKILTEKATLVSL
jgi:tRNA threonylcarbamoyladenosine modification (KEOPS) complex Cgi121 subunit